MDESVIIPDTSVVVDGRITRLVRRTRRRYRVVVPEAVVAELENQANKGRESGFSGLEELDRLRRYHESGKVKLEFVGARPEQSKLKDMDDIIRNTALEAGGRLVTSDRVQALVAEAKGIPVLYLRRRRIRKRLRILSYFDSETMSVHLKEKVPPFAKKGRPGEMRLVKLGARPLTKTQLQKMATEIVEFAKADAESFVEIERRGATVVQTKQMRISIARPPFSEAYEITAVRPICKVSLEDYAMSKRLAERLEERAEGVFIAGPPGAGKSTFAQALAEFYMRKGRIVKTMESPRDLVVPEEITQYSPLEGSMEKTADILLLVRPDYTIYDELRKTRDFQIFADMRLSGVGMVGVVHATRAIDAIQRLIKRVDLGMIPQIVDTVVYIKDGRIAKVYSLESTVKVPSGMTESDLARPLIQVLDFETGESEYEIYTFGDETVVMPVKPEESTPESRLAAERIMQRLSRIVPGRLKAQVKDGRALVWVEERHLPALIGRRGRRIEKLEKELGISLEIRALESRAKEASFNIERSPRYVRLVFSKKDAGRRAIVSIDGEQLFTATIGRRGEIKAGVETEIGRKMLQAIETGGKITASLI